MWAQYVCTVCVRVFGVFFRRRNVRTSDPDSWPHISLLLLLVHHTLSSASPPLCHRPPSLYSLGFIISLPSLLNLHSSSLLAHLSENLNLSPFWHAESMSWAERRRGTAPAWIFQQAVILNMTLSSVLSLWSPILPCQAFLFGGLNDAYSYCLSWG